MHFEALAELARKERLYPALILFGASAEERQDAALGLTRALLCDRAPDERPCGDCRHCRRIAWRAAEPDRFHPDFHILERDLRTSTSADAARNFLASAYSAPFEARGQVFVVAEAETLTGAAADAFLKLMEEPPTRTPRHFMLLAASRLDLLPTLRSRSLAFYLGESESLDYEAVAEIADAFGRSIGRYADTPSAIFLLTAADALGQIPGWQDPRARRPWATAAAAILHYAKGAQLAPELHRTLLELAEALLDGPRWRVRGISQGRILEGLLSRHFGESLGLG